MSVGLQGVARSTAPAASRRRSGFWHELVGRRSRVFYAFITPWVLGFLIFTAWPMVLSAYYSLTNYKIGLSPRWVGLSNYEYLLKHDQNFTQALSNSVIYTVLSVPLGIALSLSLALLLNNRRVRGLTFWRALFYMPTILPTVASSYMFAWMFSYRYGPVTSLFRVLGINPINFFTTDYAHWIIILFSLWGFGPGMIIFLAGLQGIPRVLYEAAAIDGAGRLRSFYHITLPGVSPVIFFQFTNGLIGAMQTFQVAWFLEAYSLPQARSVFLGTLVYSNAFGGTGVGTAGGMGYASAVAWIIFAIVLVITAINFWGARFWVHYEQI